MNHGTALRAYPEYRKAWDLVNSSLRKAYYSPYTTLRMGRFIFEDSDGNYDFISMYVYTHSKEHGPICRITNRFPPGIGDRSIRPSIKNSLIKNRTSREGGDGFEVSFLPQEAREVIDWILRSFDKITDWADSIDDKFKANYIEEGIALRDTGYFWTTNGRALCRLIQGQ